ncbi:ornithine cyclodeaminase family protein [Bacillus sp. FJAT-47783]|uniref:ornithine cyclodeaminase family protein n=1 Tax=Bacillus sp. FJAT-47783 TaxID=2922712 RepID=UPI001FAD02D9
MLIFNEKQIQQFYKIDDAIESVKGILLAKQENQVENPHRTVLTFPKYEGSALYMPSADLGEELSVVKVVTIFPQNTKRGKSTTQGVLLLSDAKNGDHLAMMNASYLTRLRTGALTGIATQYLAKKDAQVLTVIGTGGMALEQVLGVLAVRNIEQIYLVNRTIEKAHRFGEKLHEHGIEPPYEVTKNVSSAVRKAHIICCATRSYEPVFNGDDLQPGTHINGVGSYLPTMREVDLTTVLRASKIVVDDLSGVKEEAGEFIYAERQGKWSFQNIYGELHQLVAGEASGRESDQEITFFKSVGAAYFDLACAKGVYSKLKEDGAYTEIEM